MKSNLLENTTIIDSNCMLVLYPGVSTKYTIPIPIPAECKACNRAVICRVFTQSNRLPVRSRGASDTATVAHVGGWYTPRLRSFEQCTDRKLIHHTLSDKKYEFKISKPCFVSFAIDLKIACTIFNCKITD